MLSVRERPQTPDTGPSRIDDLESRAGELMTRRQLRDRDTTRARVGPAIDRLPSARLAVASVWRLELEQLADTLAAWRHVDVDELDDEPDDLRLLARLRGLDDQEPPAA